MIRAVGTIIGKDDKANDLVEHIHVQLLNFEKESFEFSRKKAAYLILERAFYDCWR